ncbi:MAG: class II fructose-bisphosphate aldolase [Oscillospiraceae bacterium]|nr:class II fructose-bisphosphate aldolase [Oscillospiraceae bacterium]
MLASLKEILSSAEKGGYAVGLFNMLNLEMARGIAEAAEEERSPLILGVAEVHLPYIPLEYAAPIMRRIAREASVPVCLHFDHGTDYALILKALKNGFNSVMYDGSALPYDENIANTREIVKIAHAMGADIEAELGHVGGGEDGADNGNEEEYTNPSQVADFIEKTDIDALAVAIGTAHGKYKKPPVLDISRLAEIYKISAKPLVLHGGSGLSETDFKNVIKNGIRKVNICTEMCVAAHKAYAEGLSQNISFEKSAEAAKNAVKQVVCGKMRLFESSLIPGP